MSETPATTDTASEAEDWVKARDTYAITYGATALNAEYWRVAFSRGGKPRQKTFCFIKLGGQEKAYAAAVAWRDAELRKTPAMTIKAFAMLRRSNNVSGVPGVTFQRRPGRPAGYWEANLALKDGTRLRKTFGVATLGYDEAFQRAVHARQEMVRAAEDRVFVHNPYAQTLAQAHVETLTGDSSKPARRVSIKREQPETPGL